MVDLRPNSAKLRDRSLRIVEAAGAVSRDAAERLLDTANGEVKTAIVMAHCELDVEDARERLRTAGGHVRRALNDPPADEKQKHLE
jgi:N-acetylmuramic acid 6-phosphate etherase